MKIIEKSKRIVPAFLCGILSILFVQAPASAGKWKTVDQDETVITFKNWPATDDCKFRKKMAENYSKEHTLGRCPRFPNRGSPSTYVWISDLSPGYYWAGNKGKDIRESPLFNTSSGWRYNFYGAEFDPGQGFICFQDTECAWRRITFKVDDLPCQYVNIIPGVGGTNDFYGQRDSTLALNLVHCGTDRPFTTENIVYTDDGKIKLIYPGVGNTESASEADSGAANNKTRLEQKCLYGDTNACKLLNSLTSKPKATENDCPDGSIDNGKGQCLVHRKEVNPERSSNTSFGKKFVTGVPSPDAPNKEPGVSDRRSTTAQKRLETIKNLEKNGLISSEEARKKRQEILKDL